jgi:hypothetical protein
MAKDEQPFEALSKTGAAMDNYFRFLQNIWGSNDLIEKMKTYTERNISAFAECVGKLSQATSNRDQEDISELGKIDAKRPAINCIENF